MKFMDGLHRTIDWYFATHDPDEVRRALEGGVLIERRAAATTT